MEGIGEKREVKGPQYQGFGPVAKAVQSHCKGRAIAKAGQSHRKSESAGATTGQRTATAALGLFTDDLRARPSKYGLVTAPAEPFTAEPAYSSSRIGAAETESYPPVHVAEATVLVGIPRTATRTQLDVSHTRDFSTST
jgi:hypothetical protein